MADADTEIVAINSDDDDELLATNEFKDQPIMQLFSRLINSDNKQSTVLTNAQIVDILGKEFSIDIWDMHELEGEIYLTIMKKYLKDWPLWDDFDRVVNNLKNKNNTPALKDMLETNYLKLKDYLKVMLDRAQVLAKSTISKIIETKASASKDTEKDSKNDDVVLEIQASRNQLNQLFFRRPNPTLNDTIFNSTHATPTQIKVNTLSLEAILNWWDIKVTVKCGSSYFYERKTTHHLNHVLVNKNLMSRYKPLKVLPQEFQISNFSKHEKKPSYETSQYITWLDKLYAKSLLTHTLYNYIKLDLKLLPENVYQRTSYRRYTNKYPYIRYLYTEVKNPDINSRKYDLQLEETISPMYRLYIGSTNLLGDVTIDIECSPCNLKYTGPYAEEELKAHYDECHSNEPDWKCTNCNKMFPMAYLAENWWAHKC